MKQGDMGMKHRLGIIAVGVAALLLASCATRVQPFRAGALPGELIHEDSGFASV
jgi:hypothetical protein